MGKAKARKWTAPELVDRLRLKYSAASQFALFEQVASGTGRHAYSWVDAVVVELWPSKGCTRRAFEVKVSRQDFLNELVHPAKNDWARKFCHEFWFVAPKDVIKEEELPERCGWMVPHGETLRIVRAASRIEEPELNDIFFASLCRSALKESERLVGEARKELMENDDDIARMRSWEKAGEAFLGERGVRWGLLGGDVEKILAGFRDATLDRQALEERTEVLGSLDRFQARMLDAFDEFCQLAHVGLLEKDRAEAFIHKTWGGDPKEVALGRLAGREKKKGEARVGAILSYLKKYGSDEVD